MFRREAIEKVIEPIITALGCEYIGMEYFPQGKRSILRIYVDAAQGVTMDTCSKVSRQIGSALDVEGDLISGQYNLEISSPGINRKLFSVEQFVPFIGKQLKVRLHEKLDGQRNFRGQLQEVVGQEFRLDVDGSSLTFNYADVAQANVITLNE